MSTRLFVPLLVIAATPRAAAQPARVGVADALEKVRPDDPAPETQEAVLEAARNEFEAVQIVVSGGEAGVSGVTARVSDLLGPSGARISSTDVILYRVGLYEVDVPSNTEGAEGPWPDPLIPDIDVYAGERRSAFPFAVPPAESRAIWVEVFVRMGTPPGEYRGSVTVEGTGLGGAVEVPLRLRVRAFELPSTATLKSAYGIGWSTACVAHHGSYEACGDEGVEEMNIQYALAALDHRVSLETIVYPVPRGGDFTHFDEVYGPLLDGTAPTRLPGARLTTLRVRTRDHDEVSIWHAHFQDRGWLDVLFDYTCDEPPAGCAYSDIPGRGAAARAAGVRTLVTMNIDELVDNGLEDYVDIITPVINHVHDKDGADRRPDYDGFLALSPEKEIWWYQSCMSHGCGGGCVPTYDDYFTGWPSYMIDVSAVQNRAMEWLSFHYRISGELYFETTWMLPDAWSTQCDFSGNGDGTLFYPGTPERIGGESHIPIESIRLKLIREGMEDYEYLALLASLGARDMAEAEAAALFFATYLASSATAEDLYASRRRIADRIEELSGTAPGDRALAVPHASGPVIADGSLDEFADGATVEVAAGDARATFRLLWDEDALHVGAQVVDPVLWVRGAGRDGELWDADGVELLFDPLLTRGTSPDGDDRHVIATVAGDYLDAAGAGATADRSLTMGLDLRVMIDGTIGDAEGDQGYTVEISTPWEALGLAPASGLLLGADLALNDATPDDLRSRDWAGLRAFAQPSAWNEIRLTTDETEPGVDGGAGDDAGTDAGPGPGAAPTGCGCSDVPGAVPTTVSLLLVGVAVAGGVLRGRRRCSSRG